MEVEVQANYFDPSAGEMDILQYFATDDFDASPGAVIVESSHSSPNSGVFNSDEHDSDSESGLQNFNTYMTEQLPEQGTILATQTLQGIQSGPFYTVQASPQSVDSSPEVDQSEKKKRGRKRRRTDEGSVDVSGDEEDVSFVTLSREELLEISSRELEDRTKKLTAIRPLTAAEQREIKRQRRLIKNREYAQASRAKKKGNMSEINHRMQSLEDENEELKRQVALLQARCNDLSNENNDLKAKLVVPVAPTLLPSNEEQIDIFERSSEDDSSSSFVNTLFSGITGFINLEPKKSFSAATNNASTALKAGVCLFMIFLSFGIFFQVGNGMFGKLPFATTDNFGDEFRFRTFGSRTLKESSDVPAADLELVNTSVLKSMHVDHGPLTMDDVLMDEAVSFASSAQINNTNAQLPRQSNF